MVEQYSREARGLFASELPHPLDRNRVLTASDETLGALPSTMKAALRAIDRALESARFAAEEMEMLRGCVGSSQREASSNYAKATDPKEREWLGNQMARLGALIAKLEAPLAADTSQDEECE